MEVQKNLIEKLNSDNYETWSFQMNLHLLQLDLWDFVSGTSTCPEPKVSATDATLITNAKEINSWKSKDQKAYAAIGLAIEKTQIPIIKKTKTSKDAWEALQTYHRKSSLTNKVRLLKKVCQTRLKNKEEMESHLFGMEKIFDQLADLGMDLEEVFRVAIILASLPDSYDTLVTALEARDEKDLTLSYVKSKLLDESSKNLQDSDSVQEKAFKIQGSRDQSKIICNYCKKEGHIKRNCFKLKNKTSSEENNQQNSRDQDNQKANFATSGKSFCFASLNENCKDLWFVDSGASAHMCGNMKFFKTFVSRNVPVHLADGNAIQSTGIGSGYLNTIDSSGKEITIEVKDVLFVPNLKGSLLSVQQLVKKGFEVCFSGEICEIGRNRESCAVAHLNDSKLYQLLTSEKVLLVSSSGIRQASTQILNLVHVYLCGPTKTQTPGGNRYFLCFVDDFSKFSVVYLMKKKSEIAEHLKDFNQRIQEKFHRKLKVMKCDNKDEFVVNSIKKFCAAEEIEFQFDISENQGIAESKARSIMEMARSCLDSSNLEDKYWGEALITSNFVQNRSCPSVEKSPFEIWFNEKANLSILKPFGTHAHVRIPKSRSTQELILVGYSGDKWRFLDRSNDSIVISKNAKFVEFEGGLDLSLETLKSSEIEEGAEIEEEQQIQIQQIRKSERSNFGKRPAYLKDFVTYSAIQSQEINTSDSNKFAIIKESLKDPYEEILDLKVQMQSENQGLFQNRNRLDINSSKMKVEQSINNQHSENGTGQDEIKFSNSFGSMKLEEEC
jgi:hypothetical protein